LHTGGLVARADPVVQRLEGNLSLRQLPFQPLVSIQTELRGYGK
jgi:hypothetical protein